MPSVFYQLMFDCRYGKTKSIKHTEDYTIKKYITDEKNGLDYTHVNGVYLPNLISTETNYEIGLWGMRHYDYIKEHRPAFCTSLMVQCKLNSYLHDVDVRAKEMYDTLVTQLAEKQGITEQLKGYNQMQWVRKMTNIANQAREIIYNDVIYTTQSLRRGFYPRLSISNFLFSGQFAVYVYLTISLY